MFLSVRVAARIVVVFAMPITRMPALSTSSTVLRAARRCHHVGALGAHVVRPERDARPALVVDRHERRRRPRPIRPHRPPDPNSDRARTRRGRLSFLPSASPISAVTPFGFPASSLTTKKVDITARRPVRRAVFRWERVLSWCSRWHGRRSIATALQSSRQFADGLADRRGPLNQTMDGSDGPYGDAFAFRCTLQVAYSQTSMMSAGNEGIMRQSRRAVVRPRCAFLCSSSLLIACCAGRGRWRVQA